MFPVAEMVLAFAWTFGANGFLIERQLSGVDTLPLAWLEPVVRRTDVTFHARPDWAMAYYLPTGPAVSGVRVGKTGHQLAARSRLALYAPYYLAPDGLVGVSGMPVDVAEYYFHALIEAALDHDRDSAYGEWTTERATELMTEVPEPHRRSAYASALADFGAHLLSIRNEISRLAERRDVDGDLCRLISVPASLFGLWRRSVEDGAYAGGYFAAEGAGPPRWITTQQALERADKERFLAEIFGVTWSGDPRLDFRAVCPSP